MAHKREKRLTKKERQTLRGPADHAHAHDHADHDHDHDHDHGAAGVVIDPMDTRFDSMPDPKLPAGTHLHCVACGRHLETVGEARARQARGLDNNLWVSVRCLHGSVFHACLGCAAKARMLLDEHDRTGKPVQQAAPFH